MYLPRQPSWFGILGGIQQLSRYDVGQVPDLEPCHPQFRLWIIDLVNVRHWTLLAAYGAYAKEIPSVDLNLIFRNFLAFQAEIVEREVFNQSSHSQRNPPSKLDVVPAGCKALNAGTVFLVEREDFLAVRFEATFIAD